MASPDNGSCVTQPLEDGNHRLVGEPGNVIVKENYWKKGSARAF